MAINGSDADAHHSTMRPPHPQCSDTIVAACLEPAGEHLALVTYAEGHLQSRVLGR